MTETNFKKHASLRGVNVVSDEANQLSWFHIRTEECQDCTFSLLPKLTEFKRGQSTNLTTLTDFAALNRLGCRAHIRLLAMTQSVERAHGLNSHNALSPHQPNALSPRGYAFTMAEILLSLTIIGVVAAITLPSLMANINERTWNTQRKALYARMSQAIAMMPQLNGYGTLTEDADGNITEDTAAESFLTEGLSKVLKINNICDSDHLADCGFPASFMNEAGSKFSTPSNIGGLNSLNISISWDGYSQKRINAKAAAFETANGESILAYYNPTCQFFEFGDGGGAMYVADKICANFIYDLNGTAGPNTIGKDMGIIAAFYPLESVVVSVIPYYKTGDLNITFSEAASACKLLDTEYRAPNLEEMMTMMYNNKFFNLAGAKYWTTKREGELAWVVSHTNRAFKQSVDLSSGVGDGAALSVRCVKR